MNLSAFSSSVSLLYFSFYLLNGSVFCNASVNLHRDGKFKYAHFRDHLFHILDVPKLEEAIVPTRNHCLLRCVKNRRCFSANTAAFYRSDGNITCDLLPTDRYSAPEKFRANNSFHHYSILSPCESFPCQYGGTCQPLYEKDEYTCICTRNLIGKHCETQFYRSCKEVKELYKEDLSEDNKAYLLKLGSDVLPVYCHMTDDLGACGDGGWTLVMKIDGSKPNFHYSSVLWNNTETFNPAGGDTGFDSQETKLPTYWNTPFSKICLGMRIGQQMNFVVINKQAQSLYELIADGKYRATSLGRNTWKTLIGSEASLQTNCGKEGFNAVSSATGFSKARVGILGNNEEACSTCDSRIGFGTGGYHDDTNTCGDYAVNGYTSDNGGKSIKAMGYFLVQ